MFWTDLVTYLGKLTHIILHFMERIQILNGSKVQFGWELFFFSFSFFKLYTIVGFSCSIPLHKKEMTLVEIAVQILFLKAVFACSLYSMVASMII